MSIFYSESGAIVKLYGIVYLLDEGGTFGNAGTIVVIATSEDEALLIARAERGETMKYFEEYKPGKWIVNENCNNSLITL